MLSRRFAGASPAHTPPPGQWPPPAVDTLLWAAVVVGYTLTLLLLWQALHGGL